MSDNINKNLSRIDLAELLPLEYKKILRERAERYAMIGKESGTVSTGVNQYIILKINKDQYYGILYHDIMNVEHSIKVTHVPNLPNYIAGVQYWHGKIIAVVHLPLYLNVSDPLKISKAFIVNVQHNEFMLGLTFSEIIGIGQYEESELIKSIPEIVNVDSRYSLGIHQGMICILNIKNILSDISEKLISIRGYGYEHTK